MTIYRRRLASSFFALGRTLENHLRSIATHGDASSQSDLDESLDDGMDGDDLDVDEASKLEQAGLALEEKSDIERLLTLIRRLPPDTKLERLRSTIGELRDQGMRR